MNQIAQILYVGCNNYMAPKHHVTSYVANVMMNDTAPKTLYDTGTITTVIKGIKENTLL